MNPLASHAIHPSSQLEFGTAPVIENRPPILFVSTFPVLLLRHCALRMAGWTAFDRRRWGGRRRNRRLVFGHGLQKCRGRYEEQVSGDGTAEVEQSVVVTGRPADEHVLEHLLDSAGRTAIANEIGAKA